MMKKEKQKSAPFGQNSKNTAQAKRKSGVSSSAFFSDKAGPQKGNKENTADMKQRVAKLIAAAGVCSRREAEKIILQGRVTLNGEILSTPAVFAGNNDKLAVDGVLLKKPEKSRLFLYYKPTGLVTTHKDPQNRPTVFDSLPKSMPRVVSVGRLDLNSEGLLLLTTNGRLAGLLENPALGWKRKYRVRVHGRLPENMVQKASKGLSVKGVRYAPMIIETETGEKTNNSPDAEKSKGTNSWLTITLTEGKNREIRKVMEFFGLQVSRLIRLSYGPFQLGSLEKSEVKEVPQKIIREQLGCELSAAL